VGWSRLGVDEGRPEDDAHAVGGVVEVSVDLGGEEGIRKGGEDCGFAVVGKDGFGFGINDAVGHGVLGGAN